ICRPAGVWSATTMRSFTVARRGSVLSPENVSCTIGGVWRWCAAAGPASESVHASAAKMVDDGRANVMIFLRRRYAVARVLSSYFEIGLTPEFRYGAHARSCGDARCARLVSQR